MKAVDPEIDELKELVRQSIKLSEDNNRVLHKMRRSIWWGRVWAVVWWVFIFIVSGAAYYYYAEPYIEKAQQLYNQVTQGGQQAQSFGQQVEQFFEKPFAAPAAPTSQ